MLIAVFAALLLIAIEITTDWLKPLHRVVAEITMPLYWVSNIPSRIGEWGDENVVARTELVSRNEALLQENLILKGQQQRMAELAAENVRLRQLLGATELLLDRVLVTELIGISPEPQLQTIVVNRGSNDAVYVGQPVLDAYGLMGQVTEVFPSYSRVLLITDSSHALPVQTLRNGVRSIAEGTGDYNRLRLRFVSPTTDIQVGDTLNSSGLGQRYPPGYPVGEVISVGDSEHSAFKEVIVRPSARIDRSRYLLLVFTSVERLDAPVAESAPAIDAESAPSTAELPSAQGDQGR